MTIHRESKSRWSVQSFARFLCSGIDRKTIEEAGREQKIGSYHQCYRLDGRLIAVGVIDLLPHGVSAVYLFYDPEFEDWELGKLSALREIALTIEGAYQYYYMGFYIHSCVKMRYKAAYEPQSILDPESLTWDPLDDSLRKKLDARPYVSLSRERMAGPSSAQPPDEETSIQATTQDEDADTKLPELTKAEKGGSVEDSDSEGEMDVPEGSLFDLSIPGVLTAEEIESGVDLDHWSLLANGMLIEMEDLVGWEKSTIRDPQGLKGIVAELAATLGPEVVKESAVILF